MAFGAKIKLSVDTSKIGSLKSEIQAAVDNATSKTPVYIHNIKVTEDASSKLLSDLKSKLSASKDLVVPIERINADAAIAKLKNDLTHMLSGLSITGLKDFLGTEGVESTYSKAAASAEKYANAMEKSSNAKFTFNSAKKQISDIQSALSAAYRNIGKFSTNSTKSNEYLGEYQRLNQEINKLGQSEANRSQESLNRIAQEVVALKQKTEAERQAGEMAKKAAASQKSASESSLAATKKQAELHAQMARYMQINSKLASTGLGGNIKSMMAELDSGMKLAPERLKELESQFSKIKAQAIQAGQTGKSLMTKIGNAYQKFGGWSLVTKSMYAAGRVIRNMYQEVTNLDTAMTELKKVTNETSDTYAKFYSASAGEAKSLGATVTDKISATADFARLGYSLNESSQLANAALVYKNVGDGISDVGTASQSIISTMKAFNIQAEDSMLIVDKFNEVGNNFAISSSDIGEALLRSASALETANNSLDESIALITAANSSVQDAEKVGTAMKSLSMYLRASKTEAEEAGESTDGMAESVSKLRNELLSLTDGQLDIQLDKDTYKSTYQVMSELSQLWDKLTDINKANILEKIGGKRNSNVLASLLENFKVAEDVMNKVGNASGSALAENEKYLDSIEGRTAQFKSTFQELSSTVLDSSAIKSLISGATSLLEVVNKIVSSVGSIPLILTSIAGGLSAIKNVGLFKTVEDAETGKMSLGLFGDQTLGYDKTFLSNLDKDKEYLNKVIAQRQKNASVSNEELELLMSGSSQSAKEFLRSNLYNIDSSSISQFEKNQKTAQIGIMAQNSSIENSLKLIKTYNEGLRELGVSQAEFSAAVMESNPQLGQYLSTVDSGSASLLGFAASAAKTAAQTLALKAVMVGLNMALTMLVSAGISYAINKFREYHKSQDELIQIGKEAQQSIENTREEYQKSSNLVDKASKSYANLAKGVDLATGKNMSLSTEDYESFLSISNQLADTFPTLSRIYDENGNAIVQLDGDAAHITSTLQQLLSVQKQIANQDIIEKLPDVFSGIKANSDKYVEDIDKLTKERDNKLKAYQQLTSNGYASLLEKSFVDDGKLGGFSISKDNYESGVFNYLYEATSKVADELNKAGFNIFNKQNSAIDNNGYTWLKGQYNLDDTGGIEDQKSKIKSAINEIGNEYLSDVNQLNEKIYAANNKNKANWSNLSDSLYAWLYTDDSFKIKSNSTQAAIQQMINSFDYSQMDFKSWDDLKGFFTKDVFPLFENADSANKVTKYLDLVTQLNGEKITIGQYMQNADEMKSFIDTIDNEELKKQFEISLGFDEKGIATQYNKLIEKINNKSDDAFKTVRLEGESDEFESWLSGLTESDLEIISRLALNTDSATWDFEDWKEKVGQERVSVNLEIDDESSKNLIETVGKIDEIIQSQSAGKSLSYEYYDDESLKDYMVALENSNGYLQLNKQKVLEIIEAKTREQIATNETNKAYAQQKYSENIQKIEELRGKLSELGTGQEDLAAKYKDQIDACKQENSSLQDKIQGYDLLNHSLSECTDTYQRWLLLQQGPDAGDLFNGAAKALQNIKEVNTPGSETAGDYGSNDYVAALEYMPERIDRNNRKQVSDYANKVLNRYLTKDKNDNYTGMNIGRFLEDSVKAGLMKKEGNNYQLNGERYKSEFEKKLDLSEGLVDAFFDQLKRKGSEYTFKDKPRDNTDKGGNKGRDNTKGTNGKTDETTTTPRKNRTKGEASIALDRLNKNKRTSLTSADLDVSGIEKTDDKIRKLSSNIDKLQKDGAKINVETDSASLDDCNKAIEYCKQEMQKLEEPAIMNVDTSKATGKTQEAIELLQGFHEAYKNLEIEQVKVNNPDGIKEAEEAVQGYMDKINEFAKQNGTEIFTTLGVDVEEGSIEGIEGQIKNIDGTVLAELKIQNPTAIDDAVQKQQTVDVIYNPITDNLPTSFESIDRQVNYTSNTNSLPESFKNIDRQVNYNPNTKSLPESFKNVLRTVKYSADISSLPKSFPSITRTVYYQYVAKNSPPSGTQSVNGTAHAGGTANLNGDWGKKTGGNTLVGELGQEIVVDPKSSKWYTVGDSGAEFVNIPKGSIVFNHIQTKHLLENGYVTGRGRAYANGYYDTVISGGFEYDPKLHSGSGSNSGSGGKKGGSGSGKSGSGSNKSGSGSGSTKKKTGGNGSTKKKTPEKEKETPLDKFKKYIETLFDWIEVRLDRLQRKTDKYIDRAEKKLSNGNYSGAAKQYRKAMSSTGEQIQANRLGASKYQTQADKILKNAISKGLVTAKGAESIKKKVADGTINISEYGEKLRTVIGDYQDWYEKSLDCADNVQDLLNQYTDYSDILYNLPIDRATEKTEDLSDALSLLEKKIDNITNTTLKKQYLNESILEERRIYNTSMNAYASTKSNLRTAKTRINETTDKALSGLSKKDKESIIGKVKAGQYIDYTAYNNLSDKGKKAIIEYNSAIKANKEALKSSKEAQEDYVANVKRLSEDMASLPNERAEKRLEKIDDARAVNDSRMGVRQDAAGKNDVLKADTYLARAEMNVRKDARREANKNVDKLFNSTYIQNALKTDSNKGKVIGEKLSTSGFKKGTKAYEYIIKYNAALDAQTKALDEAEIASNKYIETLRTNTKSQFDNVKYDYDLKNSGYEASVSLIESRISKRQAMGWSQVSDNAKNEYKSQIKADNKLLENQKSELAALKKFYDKNYKNMSKEDRVAAQNEMKALEETINSTESEIANLKDALKNISLTRLEISMSKLSAQADRLNAKLDAKQAKGLSLTAADYNTLIANSKSQVNNLEQQNIELKKQQEGLSVNSEKYLNLQDRIDANANSINQAKINQIEWNNAIKNIPFDEIESTISVYDSVLELQDSALNLKKALGEDTSIIDYYSQIFINNSKLTEKYDELELARANWIKAMQYGAYAGKNADEWQSTVNGILSDINNIKMTNEDLKDSLRDDVFWRSYDRAHDSASKYANILSGISDLLSDDMLFNSKGDLTDFGSSKLSVLTDQLSTARKEIENYSKDLENLNTLYKNGLYTEIEYNDKLSEIRDGMLSTSASVKSYIDEIIAIYKQAAQEELNALFELIDARQEALDKKKSYYDYDKTISNKTRDIRNMESQIAALEGIQTAEARAKRAKLSEELKNAKEDLDDTLKSHAFELSTESLSKLKETLNDAFDDRFKDLSSNLEDITDILDSASALVATKTDEISKNLATLLTYYGVKPENITNVDGKLASGSKGVPKDMTALTNEDGNEIIVTKEGLITPLKKGDGVIPAQLTERLYELAKNGAPINADVLRNIGTLSSVNIKETVQPVVNQHYDSLINIEGSADAATVEDLKKLVKDKSLLEASYKYTSEKIMAGSVRAGMRRSI